VAFFFFLLTLPLRGERTVLTMMRGPAVLWAWKILRGGWAMRNDLLRARSPLRLLAGAFGGVLLMGLVAGAPGASNAAVLEVRPVGADALSDGTAEKARAVKGVVKVERYLLVKTQPHDVVGVEPGAPLRIVTRDDKLIEAKLESGKEFRKQDDGMNVAIVGSKVYAEDYGYRGGMGAMATMKHLLEVGQTFKLTGEAGPRVRVLGVFSARPESEAEKVFLPLATAQKLFNQEGKVSHLFVIVEGDPEAVAKELRSALGPGIQVRVISR
jgi:hypothetical protein